MKTLLLLSLVLLGNFAFAQDSVTTTDRKAYVFLGSSVPLTSDQDNIISLFVAAKTQKALDVSAGLYSRSFTDKNLSGFTYRANQRPIHEVNDLSVSIGKIISWHKAGVLTFFAGPSFVQYVMPHNFRMNSSGGWKSTTSFEYDVRTYYLPGGTARFDVVYLPLRDIQLTKTDQRGTSFGASIGGVINYNRKITSWGLNLSLLLAM